MEIGHPNRTETTMKLEFAKFLMIVAIGAAVSAWGGATLSNTDAPAEKPTRVEVRILETAGLCHESGSLLPPL